MGNLRGVLVSLVLPCFNEAASLPKVLEGYSAVAREMNLTLILVDNGSTDHSAAVLQDALNSGRYPFLRVVTVKKNVGYGHGILTGLKTAEGDVVGFSHADLQCPPTDILRALELLLELGAENHLVKGRRLGRSLSERIVTWVYNRLSCVLFGSRVWDVNAQPKLFSKKLLPAVLQGPHDFSLDLFVLAQAQKQKLKIVEFDVVFLPRLHGESKWATKPWSRLKTILKAILRAAQIRAGRKWSLDHVGA